MKTRLTELLGIETPIICGGMMRVGTADLAAAASNAGALGVMTALTQPTLEGLEAEIARCRSLTDKPFGVNLTIGVVASEINYDDYVDVIINSGVKIVETAGRSPEPFMDRFKEAGIKVIHKCVAVRHALKAERIGVDVVSIDGFECAGHPGEQDVGGLVLFPASTQALGIPVVASGGIADGRGLAAVEAAGGDFGQVHHLVSGANQEKAWSTGDIEAGMVTVGMCGGLINDIPTCAELVRNVVSDAEQIISERLAGIVSASSASVSSAA